MNQLSALQKRKEKNQLSVLQRFLPSKSRAIIVYLFLKYLLYNYYLLLFGEKKNCFLIIKIT